MKVTWIADSGHEWLKVPLKSCKGLEISSFSYWQGAHAYLEGDCDAGLWLMAQDPSVTIDVAHQHIDGDWHGRYDFARFAQKVEA